MKHTTLGARLRSARNSKNLTQQDLAERARVAVSTIAKIESDRARDVRGSTLSALARALDLRLDDLLPTEVAR